MRALHFLAWLYHRAKATTACNAVVQDVQETSVPDVKYRGREIDAISLWSNYVQFPPNMDTSGPFLPLVECPNPNHDTFKRHFQINVEKPLVHCFAGCGISGTYEHAIEMIEGCKRDKARKIILGHSRLPRAGGDPPRGAKRLRTENDGISTSAVPDLALYSYLPPAATEYLAGRGISGASIAKWELGWNSESLRVTIPVRDLHGHLRFCIERAVRPKDMPRYLYPEHADKKSLLFGACHADLDRIRSWGVIVVEGSLDAIRIDQHGIGPVVAILGSTVSARQSEILAGLRPKRIYSMFDRDAAGIHATFSLRKVLSSCPIMVCRYPKGLNDPAELSRKEAEHVIRSAIPYSRFQARATKLMKGAT